MEKIGLEAVFEDNNFNKGITNYQNSLDTASTKTSGFSKAMGIVGGAAKIGIAGVIGIAGAAAGAAISLGGIVMKAADTAGELVDMSLKTGIGVETLQEMKYVGEQTGTSLEAITGSMTKLKRAMGDVSTNKAMAENFDKLGVSVYDANGNLRKSEDVFNDTIAALGLMTNETERDSLAMDIFGRSAVELNPLIKTGAEGLAALTEEAHKAGVVMGEEAVFGLEGFGDQVASLKASFQGIVGQIGSAVLPIFTQLTDKLVAFVQSPEFQAGIQKLIAWLSVNLPIAIQMVSDFFSNILIPAISGVWSFINDSLIPTFEKIFNFISNTLSPGLAAYAVIWEKVVKPALETVWNFLEKYIFPTLKTLVDTFLAKTDEALKTEADIWNNTLKPALDTIWDFLEKYILPIFQDVIDIATILGEITLVALAGFWEDTLKPALDTVWKFFNENILPILRDVWEFIDLKLSPVIETLAGIFSNLAETLGGAVLDALEWVRGKLDALKALLDKLHAPKDLIGDSPSPFELSLIGISRAIPSVIAGLKQIQGLSMGNGVYAISGTMANPAMSNYPISTNNSRNVSINMGNINISSGMDQQTFISQVEYAIQRSMGR